MSLPIFRIEFQQVDITFVIKSLYRPNQIGNTSFFYANRMLKHQKLIDKDERLAKQKELINEYKALPAYRQEWWS